MKRLLLVESLLLIAYSVTLLLNKSGIMDIDLITSFDEMEVFLQQDAYRLVIIGQSLKNDVEIQLFQNIFQNYPNTAFIFFIEEMGVITKSKLYGMDALKVIKKTVSVEELLRLIRQAWDAQTLVNEGLFTNVLSV